MRRLLFSLIAVLSFSNFASWAFPGTGRPYTPSGAPPPAVGYFVITAGTTKGGLGGLSGADSICLSDLQSNNWLNKASATLDAAHVHAFICDGSVCNNPQPNTTYKFAASGNATAGGATLVTDSSGAGPGDSADWSDATHFAIATSYWTNRSAGSPTAWGTTPWLTGSSTSGNCSNWSSGTGSPRGLIGTTNLADTARWFDNNSGACNVLWHLVCYVNP